MRSTTPVRLKFRASEPELAKVWIQALRGEKSSRSLPELARSCLPDVNDALDYITDMVTNEKYLRSTRSSKGLQLNRSNRMRNKTLAVHSEQVSRGLPPSFIRSKAKKYLTAFLGDLIKKRVQEAETRRSLLDYIYALEQERKELEEMVISCRYDPSAESQDLLSTPTVG